MNNEYIKYLEQLENMRHTQSSELVSFIKMFDWNEGYQTRINIIIDETDRKIKLLNKKYNKVIEEVIKEQEWVINGTGLYFGVLSC